MTTREISVAFGLSRQRIEQIEAGALRKLAVNRIARELAA